MGESTLASKLTAEFIGTFALVFSVGCNVAGMGRLFHVLSIASTLMVMIYAFGGISGGHFNPAVTFGLNLFGAIDASTAGMYMGAQILGGCVAVASYSMLWKGAAAFPSVPSGGFAHCLAEFLYTFMLVFTVFNVAVARRSQKNEYFGIAIAFTVVAGGYGAGQLCGGFFNPAIAIAVDLMNLFFGHPHSWTVLGYVAAQLAAGAAAMVMFKVVRPEEPSGSPDDATPLSSKIVSEFLGTFFLVLTIGCNVTMSGANPAAVFSIAASLMCMIYSLGNVSGGHFNPAVTIAILMSGRNIISAGDAGVYIATQLVAGCVAGAMWPIFATEPSKIGGIGGSEWGAIFFSEAWFTFVLAFTVLAVATTRGALAHFFAFAIGFCVVVGGYAIGGISGGHLNPAVSFGVATGGALHGHGGLWWKCLPYFGFQAAGGALASVVFGLTHAVEYDKSGRMRAFKPWQQYDSL